MDEAKSNQALIFVMSHLGSFYPKFLDKTRIFQGKGRLFEMGLQPYPIVIIIGCIGSVIEKGIGHV
jgi:hypothetical protein